jgi:hypothetical protein
MGPYGVMMGIILVLTPILCVVFSNNQRNSRVPLKRFFDEGRRHRYWLHISGYLLVVYWKRITDELNEPIKVSTGHYTDWIAAIEGDAVLWFQNAFENALLTELLNFHYLFIYLFLIYVTTIYYMYTGERDLTDKVTLNYLLIYALAVPYYLFFNVEVTSTYLPGMDALLYHDGWYTEFYVSHDPLDNSVPSLHIAIPFGILMLNWLHVREKGIAMKDWKHLAYHRFIVANTILFGFAIIYLGVHWIIDIPLGMMVGALGALFIHHVQPRLRNDFGKTFRGVDKKKFGRHAMFEGVVVLAMVGLLMGSIAYQAETMDDRPSMVLGPDDSKFDIIQELEAGEEATIFLTNMDDDQSIEVVLIEVEKSLPGFGESEIIWAQLILLEDPITVGPGETHAFTVDEPELWQLAIVHLSEDADGPVEVHTRVEYSGGDRVNQALLLSLPSLWMTGFVIHRLVRLRGEGRSWFDSSPSHTWAASEESE